MPLPTVATSELKRPIPIYPVGRRSDSAAPDLCPPSRHNRSLTKPTPSSGRLTPPPEVRSPTAASVVNPRSIEPTPINDAHRNGQKISRSVLRLNSAPVVVYPSLPPPSPPPPPPSPPPLPPKEVPASKNHHSRRSHPGDHSAGRSRRSDIGVKTADNGQQAAHPQLSFEREDRQYTGSSQTKFIYAITSEGLKTVRDSSASENKPVARHHSIKPHTRHEASISPLQPPPPPPPPNQPINALPPGHKHRRRKSVSNKAGCTKSLSNVHAQNVSYSIATHVTESHLSPSQTEAVSFLVRNRNAVYQFTQQTGELLPTSQSQNHSLLPKQAGHAASYPQGQNSESGGVVHRNRDIFGGATEESEMTLSSMPSQNIIDLPQTFQTQAGNSTSTNNFQREEVMLGIPVTQASNRNLATVHKLTVALSVPPPPQSLLVSPPPPEPPPQPAPRPPRSSSSSFILNNQLSEHAYSSELHSVSTQPYGPLACDANQSVHLNPPSQNLFSNHGLYNRPEHHVQNERTLWYQSKGSHAYQSSPESRLIQNQQSNTSLQPGVSAEYNAYQQSDNSITNTTSTSSNSNMLWNSKIASPLQYRPPLPPIRQPATYFMSGEAAAPRPFFFRSYYHAPCFYYVANFNRSANPLYRNRNVNNDDGIVLPEQPSAAFLDPKMAKTERRASAKPGVFGSFLNMDVGSFGHSGFKGRNYGFTGFDNAGGREARKRKKEEKRKKEKKKKKKKKKRKKKRRKRREKRDRKRGRKGGKKGRRKDKRKRENKRRREGRINERKAGKGERGEAKAREANFRVGDEVAEKDEAVEEAEAAEDDEATDNRMVKNDEVAVEDETVEKGKRLGSRRRGGRVKGMKMGGRKG